jgi:hypothetical protein
MFIVSSVCSVPGQGQAGVQIAAYHGGLRGAEGLLGQAPDLLEQLFLDLLVFQTQRENSLFVLAGVVGGVLAVAQLLLDELHLLPQVVLPLVLAHLLVGGLAELLLDGEDVELVVEHPAQHGQTPRGAQLLQQELFVLILEVHCVGDEVRHIAGVGV